MYLMQEALARERMRELQRRSRHTASVRTTDRRYRRVRLRATHR